MMVRIMLQEFNSAPTPRRINKTCWGHPFISSQNLALDILANAQMLD